ncbi:hypothetical protein IQ288_32225 [Burkholderia sp. R-69980]|nr:hypothetical protein [Burkholderia sp. R-69980]
MSSDVERRKTQGEEAEEAKEAKEAKEAYGAKQKAPHQKKRAALQRP